MTSDRSAAQRYDWIVPGIRRLESDPESDDEPATQAQDRPMHRVSDPCSYASVLCVVFARIRRLFDQPTPVGSAFPSTGVLQAKLHVLQAALL